MELEHLFNNNKKWVDYKNKSDPQFFDRLSEQQNPKYLWIGCSDSRVSANEILNLEPGEVFVHRNIGNLVLHTDFNCLSVIEYAVKVLKIKHIIVCGHYNCGGINAACENKQIGLIDNWLRNIKDIYIRYKDVLELLPEENRKNRLCELNVLTQVENICHTNIVQDAWFKGQDLAVHGLIYNIRDGILHDLAVRISSPEQIKDIYKMVSLKD